MLFVAAQKMPNNLEERKVWPKNSPQFDVCLFG
jgi:hypothetical protein